MDNRRLRSGFSGITWTNEPAPDAAFSWLPVTVQKGGPTLFRVDPAFDILARAGVAAGVTCYLNTVTGNDANDGLTAATPKKRWNVTYGISGCKRVIIQDGSVLKRADSGGTPATDIEVIGQGTVKWTSLRDPAGAWSKTGGRTNVYQCSMGGEYVASVRDEGSLDAFGFPNAFAGAADVAGVDAVAGSFYWQAGGTLYVHLFDHSDPTGNANIKLYDSSAVYWSNNTIKYFENIQFEGGLSVRNASSAGGSKAYFKNCQFWAAAVAGVEECIFENCIGRTGGDVVNYDVLNTVVTKAVEIRCDFGRNRGGTTSQASTSHYACRIVRIGGSYRDTVGQGIADVLGAWSWNLGCRIERNTSGFYLSEAGAKAWLDGCVIGTESGYGIECAAGATIYRRNVVNAAAVPTGGGGTITPY